MKLPRGICLILGFVNGDQPISVYDTMLMNDNKNKNVDWLFESPKFPKGAVES